MLQDYGVVLIFILMAVGFIALVLTLSNMLNPKSADELKASTYECGERPFGDAWTKFNVRFFIVAIIYLIFAVEIMFVVPVVIRFNDWIADGAGALVYVEFMVFVGILVVGLVYAWARGDFDWVKGVQQGPHPTYREMVHEKQRNPTDV